MTTTQVTSKRTGATRRILEALEFGPMSAADICEELGLDRRNVAQLLRHMMVPDTVNPKRIHIIGWRDTHFGQRDYPRAIYQLGAGDDVPKPKRLKRTQEAKARRKYRSKLRKLHTTNSVFNLGARP